MARVFVIHLPYRRALDNTWVPAVDISSASRHGDIVRVLDTQQRLPPHLGTIVPQVREGLKDFKADDFILLVGDQGILSVAMAIAAKKVGGAVKALRWRYDEQDYMPQLLNIWEDAA